MDEFSGGLAITLEIPVEMILQVRESSPGLFTVITTNYQKFTDVAVTAVSPPSGFDAGFLLAETRAVYDNPQMFDREQLRELAALMGIEDAETMNKKPLVKAISELKAE